jgi:hypothetical protein
MHTDCIQKHRDYRRETQNIEIKTNYIAQVEKMTKRKYASLK